jgi:hypothetical protein
MEANYLVLARAQEGGGTMTDTQARCFDCFYATYDGFCRYYLKYTLLDMVSCTHFIEDGGRHAYYREQQRKELR